MVCRTWIHNSYDGLNVIHPVSLSRWTGERCRRPHSYPRSCWHLMVPRSRVHFLQDVAQGPAAVDSLHPCKYEQDLFFFFNIQRKTEDMRFGGKDVGKRGSERSRKRAVKSVYDQHTLLHVWTSERKNEWVDKQINKQIRLWIPLPGIWF